jgi:hypothetical protein
MFWICRVSTGIGDRLRVVRAIVVTGAVVIEGCDDANSFISLAFVAADACRVVTEVTGGGKIKPVIVDAGGIRDGNRQSAQRVGAVIAGINGVALNGVR